LRDSTHQPAAGSGEILALAVARTSVPSTAKSAQATRYPAPRWQAAEGEGRDEKPRSGTADGAAIARKRFTRSGFSEPRLRRNDNTLAQAGADDGVQIGAEGTGAGKVLVGAALGLAGLFLRVGGEADRPALADHSSLGNLGVVGGIRRQRIQDQPKFFAASD